MREAVQGGKAVDRAGYYVEPTVFADVSDDMSIVREEIFGPVVVVKPFDNARGGRQASRTTRSTGSPRASGRAMCVAVFALAPKLRAGTVWVNCHNMLDAVMPFGGYKQSGWGRELGKEAVYSYLESKSLCINYGT